jgi:hypothetical protein
VRGQGVGSRTLRRLHPLLHLPCLLFTTDGKHTADLSYVFTLSALADASDLDIDPHTDDHLHRGACNGSS